MSVLDIPLRKILQYFYADDCQRRKLLKADVRLDRIKEGGGNRGQGGDFHQPFWSDVKKHLSGQGDLEQMVNDRIKKDKRLRRLYPALKDGVVDLLNEKLRWSNEPMEIIPQTLHGSVKVDSVGGIIRIKDAVHARVRGQYSRIVYPYFSEYPSIPAEGGRLALWVMRNALKDQASEDMRFIDILRHSFYSPQNAPLIGDEEDIMNKRYKTLVEDWQRITSE